MDPKVKVTRTGDGWIIRVGEHYEVVANREDIEKSIKSQLRDHDKFYHTGESEMAGASRLRKGFGKYKVLRKGTGRCTKKGA